MPRREENHTFGEVIGLLLLGLGTLLFLALISYKPKDVPEWVPIISHSAPANHPAQNFVGPLGAIAAGFFYFLFGAASYLIAAVMLGYGGAKLLVPDIQLGKRSVWVLVFVLSGACLAELQPMFLNDWQTLMRIPGKGGWIGHWLGMKLLYTAIGPVGSRILLVCLYATSLVLMTGVRPLHLLRRMAAAPGLWLQRYAAWRHSRADDREKLDIERRKNQREQQKIVKALRKKNAPLPEPFDFPEEEPIERPAPQIIDTAMAAPRKKGPKPAPREPISYENYTLPPLDMLDEIDEAGRQAANPNELRDIQNTIIEKLGEFNIVVEPGDITKGPTITRYEVYPAKGVRVDKIVSLERDLARATRAERINILAPIPGKDTVGIEIANSRKVKVTLRELLESDDWQTSKAKIPLALGKDVYGKTIIADLAVMPHCLVAGTTGSGKSVCINSIIASMIYRFTPDEMQFVMIDPKVVEMQVYENLPHLYAPVVTDPKKVLMALRRVIDEMEKRYKIFAKTGVRNITSFNARPKAKSQKELDEEKEKERPVEPEEPAPAEGSVEEYLQSVTNIRVPREDDVIVPEHMSYMVVIIDELADLMQTAPADVESAIARITQMARAAGIHMIVATQTPRADVVTGVIKANIPSRIAFQVASKLDSRVILDENGADRLLGQGDMLYLPPGTSRMTRAQGVLVTDEEIKKLVDFCKAQSEPNFDQELHEKLLGSGRVEEEISEEDEELVQKCIEIMRQEKRASTSMFQRRLRLGYTRAARVVDILEQRGYVGPENGAKPREILVDLDALV